MNTNPIIALDLSSKAEVVNFLKQFEEPLFVKVGMELYYQEGPAIIAVIKEMGHDIFLDLKLHDIPNTVKSAMKGLAKLGVNLVNVHAAGGSKMMEAAMEGLIEGTPAGQKRPSLIAVTQLTSTTQEQMNNEQNIPTSLDASVINYAMLAKTAGMDGVVCSVLEANAIEDACGEAFYKVTPGIRLAGGEAHDQKRVATPNYAKEQGATQIVVGRAITQAENPVAVYATIKQLWGGNK